MILIFKIKKDILKSHMVPVIIPNINRVENFKKAVLSVVNQSYRNIEIIVIDDGSVEEVFNENYEFLRRLKKEDDSLKINLLKNEGNKGVSYSRNRGIIEAKGDFIAFLDSDDIWLKKSGKKSKNR